MLRLIIVLASRSGTIMDEAREGSAGRTSSTVAATTGAVLFDLSIFCSSSFDSCIDDMKSYAVDLSISIPGVDRRSYWLAPESEKIA